MDAVLLRKLSFKSKIGFGKYANLTVLELLNLKKTNYLRWIYYNFQGISFVDEVLDQIHVYERYRIAKPGTDQDLHLKLDKYLFSLLCKTNDGIAIKRIRHSNRIQRARNVSKSIVDRRTFSKISLQAKNHGH